MSDKTPGERAFDKFFDMLPMKRCLPWVECSSTYKAAWEAAAEEAHTAHVDKVAIRAKALLLEYGNGFAVTHSKSPAEAKPEVDWLAINKSCS